MIVFSTQYFFAKPKRWMAMGFALWLSSVATTGVAGDMETKSIRFKQVIDLSHKITTSIPLWPGDPPVEFETVATVENNGYFLRRFSIGEHSATHMNAPNTFYADGMGIDG